jgi:hypothetical protein
MLHCNTLRFFVPSIAQTTAIPADDQAVVITTHAASADHADHAATAHHGGRHDHHGDAADHGKRHRPAALAH